MYDRKELEKFIKDEFPLTMDQKREIEKQYPYAEFSITDYRWCYLCNLGEEQEK